jgi:glycosyltransferase involved in cell wall biosynthesis
MTTGRVVIDLVAAQSPSYRSRGVARHGLDFAKAVVVRHPALVERVLLHPELPPVPGLEELVATGKTSTVADWPGDGGVFHATSAFENAVPIRAFWPRLASVRKMRLVVTVYDLIPEVFPDMYLVDPGGRRRWRACRELVRVADHVFTLSESGRADVIRLLGLPEKKVSIIGAGCADIFRPPSLHETAVAAARARLPELGERFILFNGAVDPRKNLDRLMDAYARIPPTVRDTWQLVVVCRMEPLQRNHYVVRSRQLGIEGRVLFPGFVPDEVLVSLYQAADLAVFPSLYEGYGLPVAEALACGTPVIAADNSAIRELVSRQARFDPTDTDAIAAAMSQALTDKRFRARLQADTHRPKPTWGEVADRAADVYRRLLTPGQPTDRAADGPARQICPGWRRRPHIAMVSPWPPARTPVASYSARLLGELAKGADVDVFVDGDQTVPQLEGVDVLPAIVLPRMDPWRGGYDAVLLVMSNAGLHVDALKLLLDARPRMIVLAHDVRLTELYHHAAAEGVVPEGFAGALLRMYPGLPKDVGANGSLSREQAEGDGILMAREVIAAADRFLVTSEYAAALARTEARPEDIDRVALLPLACPPPGSPVRHLPDPGLVCTFGPVLATASTHLLRALAESVSAQTDIRVAFVGSVAAQERARINAVAAALLMTDRVEFTDDVDEEAYRSWLQRCSVAVQLTSAVSSETPFEVADCLATGVPTIVSDPGPCQHLTNGVVHMPTGAQPSLLADAMSGLLADPRRRDELGNQGRVFSAEHGFDETAARIFELIGSLRP